MGGELRRQAEAKAEKWAKASAAQKRSQEKSALEERQKKANRAKIGKELIAGSMPTATGKAPRVYLQVPVMPLLDEEQEHGDLETRAEGPPISHGHSEEQEERGTSSDGPARRGDILGKRERKRGRRGRGRRAQQEDEEREVEV